MKQRRLTIVAFLLIATLVLGVGYAAVTGNLTLNGTVSYSPEQLVNDATVKFSAASGTGCVASVTGNSTAIMDVSFMDNDGVADQAGTKEYTAEAIYTISYTGDENLSDLRITPSISSALASTDFTMLYEWIGNDNIVGPGETVQLKVTVKYTVPDPIPATSVEDTFIINLAYAPL